MCAHILCEAVSITRDLAEHFVANVKLFVVEPHEFNATRDVGPENPVAFSRPPKPAHASVHRLTNESFPVGAVDGYCVDLDEYLVVCRNWFGQLGQVQNVSVAVFLVDDGFHPRITRHVVVPCAQSCPRASSTRPSAVAVRPPM